MSSVPNHIKKMANDRELVVSVRVGTVSYTHLTLPTRFEV